MGEVRKAAYRSTAAARWVTAGGGETERTHMAGPRYGKGHANRENREGTACMCISGDGALHCTLEGQHGIRRMNAICLLAIPQDQCYAFFRVAPVSSTAPLVTRLRCGGAEGASFACVDLVIPFIHSFIQ